ncbi:MAG: hypothetical protein ABW133_22695 [Polyangiaceae bacterium]
MKDIARFGAAAALLLTFVGCAKGESEPQRAPAGSCVCDDGVPGAVNPQLMAWLSKARTLHHLADLGQSDGGGEGAIPPLEELVSGPKPQEVLPEVEEVLADTYARLAELRAEHGDFAHAEQEIARGLSHAPGATYFHGHLLEVRGLVYEKLSVSLAKADKRVEAEEARQKAMRASLEAVRMQDEVIGKTLNAAATTGAASAAPRNSNPRD